MTSSRNFPRSGAVRRAGAPALACHTVRRSLRLIHGCVQSAELYSQALDWEEKNLAKHTAAGDEEKRLRLRAQELQRGIERAGAVRLQAAEAGHAINARYWGPAEFARHHDEFCTAMEDMVVELIEADFTASELQDVCLGMLAAASARCAEKVRASVEIVVRVLGMSVGQDTMAVLRTAFCHVHTEEFVQECSDACTNVLATRHVLGRVPRIGLAQIPKWLALWIPVQCWHMMGARWAEGLSASPGPGTCAYVPTLHRLVSGSLLPGAPCLVLIPGCRMDSGLVLLSGVCAA